MSHVDEGTLHALVDNALPADERAAVEAHLATCGDCARQFAEATAMARQVQTLLGALDEAPAAPVRVAARGIPYKQFNAATPLRAAALESINLTPMQRSMRTLRRIALAASVLLVAGVSYRVGMARRTAEAPAEQAVSLRAAARPAPRVAPSVVEAAPGAVPLPSAPTVRVAPRGGPRPESDNALADAAGAAPMRAPAPALAAVPPMSATVSNVSRDSTAVTVAAEVSAESRRERADAGMVARRTAAPAPVVGMSAPAASAASVPAEAMTQQMAKAVPSALPGYRAIDEVAAPAVTRRRYVAPDGATLLLQIAPLDGDAAKTVDKPASEFTVSTGKGGSTVRWQRNGLSYELQGPLAPDSLVKLATQLK